MYYFTVDYEFKTGFTGKVIPGATVVCLDGTTDQVDEQTTSDSLGRVYWEPNSVTLLTYDPFTQIKYVDFQLEILVDQAMISLTQTFNSIIGTINYQDGSQFVTTDFLAGPYGSYGEGKYDIFTCVRYII